MYLKFSLVPTKQGVVMGSCFYPSLQALEEIARDYPHATLIISYRREWFDSVQKWSNLVQRWTMYCPAFPNATTTNPAAAAAIWQTFYQQHQAQIRALVQRHSTLKLWEIDLNDSTQRIGQQLEAWTGISRECWGKCQPETGECFYPES